MEDFKLRFYTNFIKDDRYMYLVTGLGNTLAITFLAVLLGIVLGFLVAIIRSTYDKTGRGKIPNFLCTIYLTIIRGTPMMVQLMIMCYVVFGKYNMSKLIVATLAFGINSGAYVAEIVRSGIMSIDSGPVSYTHLTLPTNSLV